MSFWNSNALKQKSLVYYSYAYFRHLFMYVYVGGESAIRARIESIDKDKIVLAVKIDRYVHIYFSNEASFTAVVPSTCCSLEYS